MQPETTQGTFSPAQMRVTALLAVGVVVCSWGFGSVLVKLMSIDGISLALYRLWLGAALAGVLARVSGRTISMGTLRTSAAAGAFFGSNVVLAFVAVNMTAVANVNLIAALQPALVLLVAAPLFGERIGRGQVGWTAVSIAAVAVVVAGGASQPAWSLAGDLLAAASVLLFTAYFLISKHVRTSIDPIEYIFAVQLVAAITITPVAVAHAPGLDVPNMRDLLFIAIIVCFMGVGGHMVVSWAHAYADVSASSLVMVAIPVVAGASAWAILDEPLTAVQIAGSVVALAAIVVVIRLGKAPSGGELRAAPKEAIAYEL
jgi:drug/metabolite transporter (DMT)-like permease